MKIKHLQENLTPASTPSVKTIAPKFGRSDEMLESDSGTTGAGAVASVSQPVGKMQRRGKGSMFAGIKTSAKYPNSAVVKEGAYEDGVRDGIRGDSNPRASSIYGPEASEYARGYKDGIVKGKEEQQQNVANYQAELAPYKEIETDRLKQMLRDIRKRSDETQAIFDKYRGASRFGGDMPPNVEELKKQGAIDNKAWQAIHQELFQRGVPQDQRMDEADEWEEDTEKRERFIQYAKQKLITAKKNNQGNLIDLANALSAQDNKIFGSPFIDTDVHVGLGAVNVSRGEKFTKAISNIMNWLNSGQGMAQVTAQQAAVWLQPHGKEFLERVHSDLLGMQDNSEEQRIKHAIALSGYQVEHLGGKVRGSFKGDYSSDPADNMTQEVYDIYKVVEIEIAIIHQQRRDAQELADQKKIWESVPMPIKVAMAASHGMTPGQMEAMLFGKTESDKIAGYFNNSNQEQPEKELAEGNPFLQQHGYGGGKFPEPRKPRPDGIMSKSEVLGKDGLVYHWQDPRAKQGVGEAKKANTKTARQEFGKRVKAKPSEKEQEQRKSESDAAWERLMAYAAAQKKEQVDEKSVSQAQFRTMAAAAHNPKFAKKVGIKQNVAKEFHKSDRKQDYKDLPAKVEAANPAQQAAIAIAKKKKQGVDEASPETTFNVLKGLKTWQVVIMNNYYRGKYSDYSGRYYYVLAHSPEEAKQVVLDNADGILQELLAMKSHNGKKILPRGSAVPITPERVGSIEDGTVAGRMSTAGFKKMFGPQGPMMVKLSGGAVVDIQSQEQPVDEASFDYTMKDLGNDYAGFPSQHSLKHKMLVKIKPEKQQLYKDKMNNTRDWDSLFALFKVAKERGDIIEPGETRTMGLDASLEQHADDKMKELGHKFKPVDEGYDDYEAGTKGFRVTWTEAGQKCTTGLLLKHHAIDSAKKLQKKPGTSDIKVIPYRSVEEEKQRLDPKCWKGYKKQGTKMKGGIRVNNCVPVSEAEFNEDKLAQDLYKDLQIFKKGADRGIGSKAKDKEIGNKPKDRDIIAKENFNGEYDDEAGSAESNLLTTARAVRGLINTIGDRDNLPEWVQEKIAKAEQMLVTSWDYLQSQKEQGIDPELDEDWQKVNKSDNTDGMSRKAVKAYRRENPGSKLKTAVTTKPSKLKAGSKDAKRRKSFCARMSGVKGPMKDEKGRPTAKAKALRRWNC